MLTREFCDIGAELYELFPKQKMRLHNRTHQFKPAICKTPVCAKCR